MMLATPLAFEDAAVQSTTETVADETVGITFLNLTGDITVTWSPENDAKMKELIRKKMKEGFVFFTTRKVPLTEIPFKRKLGEKGVETIKDLIIKDKDFEKIVRLMDDADIAREVVDGTAKLGKRPDDKRQDKFDTGKRIKDPDEVKKGDRLLAARGFSGG